MLFWRDSGLLVDASELEALVDLGSSRSENLNLEVQGCSFLTFFSATKQQFFLLSFANWNCVVVIILLTFMCWVFVSWRRMHMCCVGYFIRII